MTVLAPRREVSEFRKRYKWMALFITVCFAFLFGRSIQLQLVDHANYAEFARENVTRTLTIPATRGLVYDTKGRVIATNEPSYNVYVTPQLLDVTEDLPRLGELMGMDEAQLAAFDAKLQEIPPRRQNQQILMFSEVSRDAMAAIETHGESFPGVDVIMRPIRRYPFDGLGGHAIGYLNEVTSDDLQEKAEHGYRMGDRIGRMGVERAWESYLRGQRGFRRVFVDARGRRADGFDRHEEEVSHPIPGSDLTLTLDMDLMRNIDRAFRGHPSGAAVVVDVRTGRVRALYSKPSYDLNEMTGRLTTGRFQELQDDPFRPLIDKTIFESYYPGSTFKPVSALAALGDEVLDPNQRIECPGYYEIGNRKFRCTQAHGEVDMRQAIVRSCNVYFWKLAERVGLDRLARYAKDLGLGEKSGVGINSETPGFIPTRRWHTEQHGQRFRVGFTLNTAIGQGNTRVNLVQLALVYAAIANGGVLYVPQLVEQVSSPEGAVIESFEPRVRRRISIGPEHLAYVIDGLYGVVNDPNGTAFKARIQGSAPVAGKTGTAQVPRVKPAPGEDARRVWYRNRDHAWFAGFAPAADPKVAVVVLVEHGGGGGKTAAPIALQILEEYLHDEGVDQARSRGR